MYSLIHKKAARGAQVLVSPPRITPQIEAGAELIVTQLFYDVDIFFKFVKDCRSVGIAVPILPGEIDSLSLGTRQKGDITAPSPPSSDRCLLPYVPGGMQASCPS